MVSAGAHSVELKPRQQRVSSRQENTPWKVFSRPPVVSSNRTPWEDIRLEYHEQPKCDTGAIISSAHQILMCLPDRPLPVERWLNDQFQAEVACAGNILIAPAKSQLRIRRHYDARFMLVSFEPQWLDRINQELADGEAVQLLPAFPPVQDPVIQGILFGLKQEVESDSLGCGVYADQLKITLALHLLRNYTIRPPRIQDYGGGLPHYQLRRTVDYIQANLDQTIKLEDLAQLLGMSQFYFCRLFRESMGMPPHQYIIAQRIERAKTLLRQSKGQTIAEIALACGFSNQSHLSKHFRKLVGSTPNAYRKGRKFTP